MGIKNFKFTVSLKRESLMEPPRDARGRNWNNNHARNEMHEQDEKVQFNGECHAVNGAFVRAYREVGCGFLGAVYQECLAKNMDFRGIPFVPPPDLNLSDKQRPLSQRLTLLTDFVVESAEKNTLANLYNCTLGNCLSAARN
jgi:hypothetical protein